MSIYLGTNLISGAQDISGKANTDFDNITSTAKNIGNWSSNVTNCITDIPQDIKLELSSGTLTLKAGSKVYVPNGFESDGTTPKYEIVITESDLTKTISDNDSFFVYYDFLEHDLRLRNVGENYSGNTAPTSTANEAWYNTANNIIKYSGNTGSTWSRQYSFPLCQITATTSNGIVSIDQVFNGFGYIGSTVFALPGVKGLIPDGRNADGTLKNAYYTINSVIASTRPNNYTYSDVECSFNSSGTNINYYTYNENENKNYIGTTPTRRGMNCVISSVNGVITKFTPKTVFHALDWNDSSEVSGWGMPSDRYIDLTLGASGTTYTAPANGWFCLGKTSGGSSQAINMKNHANKLFTNNFANSSAGMNIYIPSKKGDVITVDYTASGTTNRFVFIYAEGEI